MMDWKDRLRTVNVDVDTAIASFCNKEERYIKYLKLFADDNNYGQLLESLNAGDVRTAFESCHALKGIVGNLGFTGMFSNIYEACELLRAGKMDGVPELVNSVDDNYNRIIEIIKECLA